MKSFYIISFLLISSLMYGQLVWVETELFDHKGGWINESQFVDQMGSPYLMAHGLGLPVEDAHTIVEFPETGEYHFWVRTKDWVPTDTKGPGKFKVLIADVAYGPVFGADGIKNWHWAYGGTVNIGKRRVRVSLQDLTGFEGRCDIICFSRKKVSLPDSLTDIERLRYSNISVSSQPQMLGRFDLVVVGGGVAGICAAVQAARLGVKVALVQNRPVLGGNSSSEVRVSTDGSTFKNKYRSLGRIVREIDNYEAGVGGVGHFYRDGTRQDIVLNEPNITLFTNLHVNRVEIQEGKIKAVGALNLETLEKFIIEGELFADCTGDASVGILAGADHRYGREAEMETGETSAPATADNLVMGSSNQWRSVRENISSDFPVETWMFRFSEDYHFPITQSRWDWESGFNNLHTVDQAEEIRDLNLCAVYSNWSFLKTFKKERFSHYRLSELQHVTGKRESYRLLGDLILTEQDIVKKVDYPDAVVTTTWGIDLHYPHPENSKRFPGMEFIAYAEHPFKQQDVYTFPYRCLYSRNVPNLFMAGRNISVTHIALGTVRVQRCTGMMGEVVGLASYLCLKRNVLPRGIYEEYLDELLQLVQSGGID
ncbi:FAD-dependent oxidoreductase [Proteiniphilum sp.]|uniref:FAD-dependent oxidoreductase n=1 Tax=Proteiniphilum sp. TaxID=1926877 RepID=UPI002B20823D|nr:FAD-dependent oxidoreductase [Proteiniphilum sp.]MEA4918226.1 FAD-dependent oxidoreductase [Proteiniphilum sp.]